MSEIKKLLKEKYRAIQQGQYKEAASACNAIGSEYCNQEKYDEALEQHLEELEYCKQVNDQLGIAVANRRIGECYTELNNFKKALRHIKKFHDISVNLKSVIEEQRALATFGRTYYMQYQYESASEDNHDNSNSVILIRAELSFYKALKLLYELKAEVKPVELAEMRCRLLLNLGLIHEARGKHESSLKHVKKALDIASENSLHEDIYRCGYAVGTLFQKVGKFDEAVDVLNKAVMATKKLRNKNLTCEVLLCKGINLISLEKYGEAKQCLKSAYKMRTTSTEDFEKIVKALKVCIGVYNYQKRLEICKNLNEKKVMLERIADGLSSINCYKLAVEKYLLTLKCMTENNSSPSEEAPIYYSLAQTYLDDGSIHKALEYFEKEYNCHMGKPLEQVETVWKMAEIWENEKKYDKSEELYLKAVSLSEDARNQKFIHSSLSKLLSFYNKINKADLAEDVRKKLDSIAYECLSDEENENGESQEPFNDIDLKDLSDTDNNEEVVVTVRKRSNKKIENKVNDKGETPLHQACIDDNLIMVKKLIENGHSVNVRDFAGWTPLHEACNYGFYDIVVYLLENGADINDPGGPACKGITALHDAASCGNFDVIHLLISKGASVTAVDENGETALDALLQWKKRNRDLDEITLNEYKSAKDELKSKMAEAGLSVDESYSDINMTEFYSENVPSTKVGEKRNRSPSSSSDIDSDDESEINVIPPYININNYQDWDDADEAKAEYKSVMENLRRSAADISPMKSQVPKVINGPPLVDENEIVNEWLIKDTNDIPKIKRKKRRITKLNVRTSECIDNYLVAQNSEERNSFLLDEDSNVSIKSVNSTSNDTARNSFVEPIKNERPKVTFCLRVNIAGKLILVPVPEDTCTVSWLQEEAAVRYQTLDGRKPYLCLTKNGALLSDTDLVRNIFSNNEEVFSSVERWDEQTLEDKYAQLCKKHNTVVSSSVRQRFQRLETSCELNFSNCNIPFSHINVIFCTVSNYECIQHLNFSCTPLDNSNVIELANCIPSFSILLTLNLSCCSLTSQSIKILVDYLNDQTPKNVILPSLKILDLSYNIFSSSSCFDAFFKLNSLVSVNLSSCGLSSTFLTSKVFDAVHESQNIEVLDISGNVFESDEISNLLHHFPRKSLKKLNLTHTVQKEVMLGAKLRIFFAETLPYLTELALQGCYLTDIDIDLIAECLSNCPQLQICDLSANPSLSGNCVHNFIVKAYENNLNITDLNITGTCKWENDHLCDLTIVFKLKTLKHLYFDSCPDPIVEKMVQLWIEKWGSRAIVLNLFCFCELSVK